MKDRVGSSFIARISRGELTMEGFARELIRMDGSSPRGPCLEAHQGARLPQRRAREPEAQSLFAQQED